jgi:hypothetical protein
MSETAEFAGRNIAKDEPPVTSEPLGISDSEDWAWMVDDDPAFYLSKSGNVEGA